MLVFYFVLPCLVLYDDGFCENLNECVYACLNARKENYYFSIAYRQKCGGGGNSMGPLPASPSTFLFIAITITINHYGFLVLLINWWLLQSIINRVIVYLVVLHCNGNIFTRNSLRCQMNSWQQNTSTLMFNYIHSHISYCSSVPASSCLTNVKQKENLWSYFCQVCESTVGIGSYYHIDYALDFCADKIFRIKVYLCVHISCRVRPKVVGN